jgi:hypothetical protein
MIWYFRMMFGLPPRDRDLDEMARDMPELLDERGIIGETPEYARWDREAIRRWIKYYGIDGQSRERIRWERSKRAPDCPRRDCPLRADGNHEIPQGQKHEPDAVLDLMSLGGGQKKSFGLFIDLVRRVYAKKMLSGR